MRYSTQVKPISYLKSHTAQIVNKVMQTKEPMLITQNGEAKLVVMDVKSYEAYEETLVLLKLLVIGNLDIEAGKYRSAKDVFSDLDKK